MSIRIPLGVESFAEIRESDAYYVDKTAVIKELLAQSFKVTLITRPRRFGKSLTVSMLEDFFDISRDSKAHFDGLAISRETALCGEWQNKWPVAALTLKSVEGLNFEDAYGMLEALVADLYRKYDFLEESARINSDDKKIFRNLKCRKADKVEMKQSLAFLTRMMSDHFGKPAILLIDEYDVPLAKANENGYYRDMLDMIRAMLGAVLKTNPYLKFGIVTGCLKISKESIFTGLNNLVANTITSNRLEEGIGFTEPEVLALLADAGFADHAGEVRQWYDGYRFGRAHIYCPWDVLNHVAALLADPKARPRSYWENTSGNDAIYKLFENETFDVDEKFETLLAGGCIRETVTEELTYDSLDATEENLWSLLFMTGYLTLAKEESRESGEELALRIPNEEIKGIFRRSVVEWFQKSVQTADRSEMFRALWEGDAKTAEEDISDLLFTAISYHDYRESFYHAFVAGLFAGAGYVVRSNRGYGGGRPDVVILEKRRRRALVFEIKHAREGETLDHAVREALDQIRGRRYAEPLLKEGYRTVVSYGIAFWGKECRIKLCEKNE